MNISPELFQHLFKSIGQNGSTTQILYDLIEKKLLFLSPNVESICHRNAKIFYENPEIIKEIIHPDDKDYVFNKIKKEEDLFETNIEFRLLTPKFKPIYIKLKAFTIKDENDVNRWVLGYAENISQRKEAEINLLDINEKKDATLQILAHDLRGPLGMIRNATDLLSSGDQEESEKEKILRLIDSTTDRSIRLINDLLQTEFHETQKVDFKRDRLDIIDRFHSIIQTYQLSDKGREKKFIVEPKNKKIYLYVDELKFMLIINNLISNAYKFTPEKGVIKLSAEEKEKTMLIKIQDNGIGIPDNLKPIIFDKFTKARRTGLQGERPVGLGMIIIKRMVELHNGDIWFESEEGGGTTFYVEIPKYGENNI